VGLLVDFLHNKLAAESSFLLAKPMEVAGITVIPVLETNVVGSKFGFMAALSPIALVLVRGEEYEVASLGKNSVEKELFTS
jgi:hypothetical protein